MELVGGRPLKPLVSSLLYRMIYEPAADAIFFRAGNAESVRALYWLRADLRRRNVPLRGNLVALSPYATPNFNSLDTGFIDPGNRILVDLKNHPGYLAPFLKDATVVRSRHNLHRFVFEAGCMNPRQCMEVYKAFLVYALVSFELMDPEDYPEYEDCFEFLGTGFRGIHNYLRKQ
jgi:hypothetical protein